MDEIAAASLKSSKGKQKFYKSTFENISEEKREKILDVAISEFASKGYNATNINIIAKKAEISIGSMYSYFDSKEALFLTIMESGFHILEKVIREIDIDNSSTIDIFERLLLAARDYAISYPEFNQIYLTQLHRGCQTFLKNYQIKWNLFLQTFTGQ
jgi:AcrR family transcriptional regulator